MKLILRVLENYALDSPERVAGSGFNPSLLRELDPACLKKRAGCSMHFTEISNDIYEGKIEPGNCCIINRKGVETYLISHVKLDQENWICNDIGIDRKTNSQAWGSRNGYHHFKRINSFGDKLNINWLR